MCDEYTSRFDLYSAKFGASEYIEQRLRDSKLQQHMKELSKQIQPEIIYSLRNPSFQIMRKEIENCKEKNGILNNEESNINQFLSIMNEMAEVTNEIATYNQLNEFIRKTLVPYTQNWHKRTFKVIDSVNKTKNLLSNTFNQTKALLFIFNETIKENIIKTDKKLVQLTDLIFEETIDNTLKNDQIYQLSKEIDTSYLMIFLKYFSIIESIFIILFYFYKNFKLY